MAYENATAVSIADLFDKLATFATANGWTKNEPAGSVLGSDRVCFSKNSVFVNFRWATASPTAVAIYQATGYTSGPAPGGQANDSGNGYVPGTFNDTNVRTSRCAYMTNASMTYWFFENDSSPAYIHVVVTIDGVTSGKFSHFGFGELVKQGTWTGGEYVYGHYYNNTGTAGTSMAASSQEFTCLLDGGLGGSGTAPTVWRPYAATVRMENLPGQAAGTRWGLSWADVTPGTDRGGNARYNIQGGFRGGPVAAGFGRFLTTPTTGLTAMYPINLYYDRGLVSGVRQWYPMGYMADVRGIDIQNYTEGTELTVGSDIWIPFAANYRQTVTANGATQTAGIAYKKVTT